jgi:hypothetical protein
MLALGATGTVPVMLNCRIPLLLVLAALVAAAIAQPASARFHEARFLVKFDGNAHSTWNLPRYQSAQDCYRTTMFEAGGEESWHVASSGEQKLLVYGNGVATQFQIGSWVRNHGSTSSGLIAKGQVNRSRHENVSYEAGTCGVTMKPLGWDEPKEPMDCGTRLVNYEVQLGWTGRAAADINPDVLTGENGIREKLGYKNCNLVTPDNVVAGTWPLASGHIMAKNKPVKNFWGTQKELVAVGKDSWDASRMIQSSRQTASVSVDWKLTFTRVGKVK